MNGKDFRIESDLIGALEVPAAAYYGIHTTRAVDNFQISGIPISAYPDLLVALADVKQAAAEANSDLGLLEPQMRDAIAAACGEIRLGQWHDHFVVDIVQGGAGTSTNMNANEVICNRALELLGHKKGDYQYLDPIEHVNRSQSTNDVYPTAVRIAIHFAIKRLLKEMALLRSEFDGKAIAFADLVKLGRTQLQDAVPMTLGQEFSTYAVMLEEDMARLEEASNLLLEVNLGATAIGTGITAPPQYAKKAVEQLVHITGIELRAAPNLIEATQDCGVFVQVSGVLKRIAVKLSKTCNDLRLLASGPRAGFAEIRLPAVQAGSSIMPGKVNPVIPEVINQIAFEVFGNDLTVTFAAEAGQLQLNAFEPIIAVGILKSLRHLTNGCKTLASRCVSGIKPNRKRLQETIEQSLALATALTPIIGYKNATAIATEAEDRGTTIRQIALEKQVMTERELDEILSPERLIRPGYPTKSRK